VAVSGGQAVVLTIDEDSFTTQAMLTALLLLTAMRKYVKRSTER